jgi:hypothetical protein
VGGGDVLDYDFEEELAGVRLASSAPDGERGAAGYVAGARVTTAQSAESP